MVAQGWPSQYGGVMLQGFYWDSYADTKWTNLESQADEMSAFFDLIWVPNSAYANASSNNMGYHPVYWFNHKSAFGTEAELRSMIQTFKQKGTGIIEDVVINHRASVGSNWLVFPKETYNGVEYELTAADICSDDEAKDNGYTPTGAKDTGEGWGGARDLDHTGSNVQKNVMAYEDFLLHDLGYAGFRYDFVKGFAPRFVGLYNKTADVQFSVGECWDGNKTIVTNWLNGTKQDGVIQSAAFDFPLKYYINDAFSQGKWSRLNGGCLADDNNYKRYAVTFVDNHDTGRSGECPLYANVEAANAYILTMPGTPCVWLGHWKTYKTTIKRLITVRRAVGITNQSAIITKQAKTNGYVLVTEGQNGNAALLLGSLTEADLPTGNYKLALEGTSYKLYVTEDVDLSALDTIKDETFTAPDFCTVADGEVCAFFEAPNSWSIVKCWAWDGTNNYTGGSWPGAACTKVGRNNGKFVWKWSYSGSLTTQPTFIIFNNNNNGQQTADLTFQNGGYYNDAGALQGIVTGIDGITSTKSTTAPPLFSLDGRRVTSPRPGIYIQNNKKIVIR
jgi:alpha-amylase